MPEDFGLWAMLGIKVPSLFSGIAGGIVGAWADGKSSATAWASYVIGGGLTGAYLGEWASHFIPYTDNISAGFAVGGSSILVMRLMRGYLNRLDLKLAGNPDKNGGK